MIAPAVIRSILVEVHALGAERPVLDEASAYELDVRVARLEAAIRGGRRPIGEPPEAAWIAVGAHQWATDAWCIVRRDGPRPAPEYPGHYNGWRTDLVASSLAALLESCLAGAVELRPDHRAVRDGAIGLVGHACGHVVYVQGPFAPLVRTGELRQRSGTRPPHEEPIVVLRRDEPVAVVMPWRAQ